VNYTQKEIIKIFFLVHKIRQKEFKNKSHISDDELRALATNISEIKEYLEFDEERPISYQTIKRIMKMEMRPVNVKRVNIDKLVKYLTQDKFAELGSLRFIENNYAIEFNNFIKNYSKNHDAFFRENDRFKIIDGTEIVYDFKKEVNHKKNDDEAIVPNQTLFDKKVPRISDLEIQLANIEAEYNRIKNGRFIEEVDSDLLKEINNYIMAIGEDKVKLIYESTILDELNKMYLKLNRAIKFNRYLGLGMFFITIPSNIVIISIIHKRFKSKLQETYSEDYEVIISSEDGIEETGDETTDEKSDDVSEY